MDSLVSTDWLAGALGSDGLAVVDASAHLPSTGRDARDEFASGHIPRARFLDLQSLKDPGSPVPNALPTAEQFAARMRALGVAADSRVVLYDDSAVKTSARAWLMFRMNGLRAVAILDGGLAKWKAEGRLLEAGEGGPASSDFAARAADWSRVRSKADMIANIASGAEQTLDARDAARFTGATRDTLHDLPGGHIPGARNLPYTELFRANGTYRPSADLRTAFEEAGVDLDRPVVTTCGSGVTASVLLFAMHLLGKDHAALYDGSWSEWGADPRTPKETAVPV
jgi:thiosulfate/3-mercaptopyruvate sulfurtransferase